MLTIPRTAVIMALLGAVAFLSLTYLLSFDAKNAAVGVVTVLFAWNTYRYPRYYLTLGGVALIFACFVTTMHQYEYDTPNLFLGHMNLFPLVMWTAGLVLARDVYVRLPIPYRLVVFTLLYWVILFILEYIGFYWVGIRLAPGLPSLFNTGVLHGTPAMHVFYILAGPIYIIVTDYIATWYPWLNRR